jgi:hypothetical protein
MHALLKLAENITQTKMDRVFVLTFRDQKLRDLVLSLNKEGQLRVGQAADGSTLPLYSRTTEIISGGRKRAGTPYTLFDTGQFYQSFNLLVTGQYLTIDADTQKPDKDLREYGDILGLTEESSQELIAEVLPYMREVLLDQWFKDVK